MKKLISAIWYWLPGVQWDNISDVLWDAAPERLWQVDDGFSDAFENAKAEFWLADRAEEAAQNRGKAIKLKFSRLHYSKRRLRSFAEERRERAWRELAYSQAQSLECLAQIHGDY